MVSFSPSRSHSHSHSSSSSSSLSSSSTSPTLSSPSTSATTPSASHCSPIPAASSPFPMAASKGVSILDSHQHNNGTSNNAGSYSTSISGPFGFSDYFSSSVPKSSFNNNSSNSIHIGSLSNTLGNLGLADLPTTSSSLSSGLYNYSFPNGTNGNHINLNNGNNSVNANGPVGSAIQEEISTIFVVGFPEDMQEREFQNMFVFTPGFEAATLKIPNKDQQEDDALTLGVNGVNPRKQIIGFAKFRSQQEALQARDVLNGRRVDAEKGSLLKAEMAKKNLHTRRGLSNELVATTDPAAMPPTPTGLNVNRNGGGSNGLAKLPPMLQHRNSLANAAAYDAFHSVPCSPALPSDLLSPKDYPSSYDFYADVYAPNNMSFAESFGGRRQSSSLLHQQQQLPELSSSFLGRQNGLDGRVDPLSMGSLSNNNGGGLAGSFAGSFPNSMSNSFSNNRTIGFGSSHSSQRFHKGFMDPETDVPVTTSGFLSKSIPALTERGFNSMSFNGEDITNNRFQGLPVNTAASVTLASPSLPSPGIASPGFRAPVNPGDQNPPCNTLYVGNLPMNTSEDELRTLFSRCVGYRRLCFRTKSNGPMCFVEFENVECATQALNDLYGNPLSNSVKGGIRLSFSKNPLGVRNSTPSQSSSLGHQLHSSFLDRRDSMSAMFDQHY